MRSILKYPGSKGNIANQLVELIPPHKSYLEAYAGSLAVLFQKPPSAIETINDLDGDVVNLFRCIQQDAGKLASMVMTTPYSREVYDLQFTPMTEADPYKRACNFLIRCWQGHGYRTNGSKVGWKNDVQGRERAYALWDWYRLPDWIIEVADRLRRVQIEHMPAIELIKRFNYSNVFMFLDPPYLLSTRTGKQYKHEMSDNDHKILLQTIVQSKAKIMICGYQSDLYDQILAGWHKEVFSSCAQGGGARTEIIWMNYKQYEQMSIYDICT